MQTAIDVPLHPAGTKGTSPNRLTHAETPPHTRASETNPACLKEDFVLAVAAGGGLANLQELRLADLHVDVVRREVVPNGGRDALRDLQPRKFQ